jgi:intein/homing endonuclease
MTIKLKSKTYKRYTGKVYDLSVENKSSYNVEGIPVHNSGAGSLVCYLLGITQVDPIKHGLLFERFLSKKKMCLPPDTYIKTQHEVKQLKNVNIGDMVLTHTQTYKPVVHKENSFHNRIIVFELDNGTILKSSPNHLWIVLREGIRKELRADEIKNTDEFIEIL